MKRLAAILLSIMLAGALWAGTDSDAVNPGKVREETKLSMARWVKDPTGAAACGGSDCCPGTATDAQCLSFAKGKVDKNPEFWAPRVEEWYTRSGSSNWECNQFYLTNPQNPDTFCGAWPATQSVRDADVAIALADLAALEE